MKKICSECRYWERTDEEIYGNCTCEKFIYTGEHDLTAPDQFGYTDYECYLAFFYPGEAFGCIHWEGK